LLGQHSGYHPVCVPEASQSLYLHPLRGPSTKPEQVSPHVSLKAKGQISSHHFPLRSVVSLYLSLDSSLPIVRLGPLARCHTLRTTPSMSRFDAAGIFVCREAAACTRAGTMAEAGMGCIVGPASCLSIRSAKSNWPSSRA